MSSTTTGAGEGDRAGRLVISADDFGITAGVNRAIVDAFERGTISSATLLLGQPGSEEALRLAAGMGHADFGIHLNLTDGVAASSGRGASSLVDSAGRFRGTRALAVAALAGRLDLDAVRRELDAQLAACVAAGVTLTHADSHQYVHALPGVHELVMERLAAYGIRLVRASSVRSLAAPLASAAAGGLWEPALGEAAPNAVLHDATDFVVSLAMPRRGPISLRGLERVLTPLAQASVELIVHPGYEDEELAEVSRYSAGRAGELTLLASPEFTALITRLGYRRVSFSDLARERGLDVAA